MIVIVIHCDQDQKGGDKDQDCDCDHDFDRGWEQDVDGDGHQGCDCDRDRVKDQKGDREEDGEHDCVIVTKGNHLMGNVIAIPIQTTPSSYHQAFSDEAASWWLGLSSHLQMSASPLVGYLGNNNQF